MNIGDKIVIGGRTMLRPGFSLVGLEGVVMPASPNLPPDCTTVLIDWQSQGYDADNDLPLFVNVPTSHLSLAEDTSTQNTTQNKISSRPILGFVRPQETPVVPMQVAEDFPAEAAEEGTETSPLNSEENKNEVEDVQPGAEEKRPRLRLI